RGGGARDALRISLALSRSAARLVVSLPIQYDDMILIPRGDDLIRTVGVDIANRCKPHPSLQRPEVLRLRLIPVPPENLQFPTGCEQVQVHPAPVIQV